MSSPSRAVFLSYASQDVEAAARMAAALKEAGIEVWFDRSELRGGDAWDRNIRNQIRDCALFVPIISAATEARLEGYFRREWKLAVERTQDMADGLPFIVPALVDAVPERQAHVPEAFRSVQWTRLINGEPLPALVANVSRFLRPAAASIAAPAAAAAALNLTRSFPPPRSQGTGRRALWIGGLVVVLAGVAILVAQHARKPLLETPQAAAVSSASARDKSIAVLPFVDMSEAKDKEYFSDGLSEELIDHLVRSPELRVIARTSSFQFKGKNDDVRRIGETLGVSNLLEGSVRTAGQSVRISVQLIRSSDGSHLWSQTYDRQLSDLFAVQDEIAETVVQSLRASLSGRGASAAVNTKIPAAHDLMLKGNYFYLRAHSGDLSRAIEQFKAALALDPNYALAWVALARAYIWEQASVESSATEHELMARDALQRALTIDPSMAAAHHWMGRVYMNFRWDWAAARQEFERAAALDPESAEAKDAHGDLATMQGFVTGNFEQAILFGERDIRADPLSTSGWYDLCWTQRLGRQLRAAAESCRRLLDLDAEFGGGHMQAALIALELNDTARALELAKKEVDEESRLQALAVIYWKLGQHAAADQALHELEAKFAKRNPYDIGTVYAYRGQSDEAFKRLEEAFAERDGGMIFLRADPLLDQGHSDPRYRSLIARMSM